MPLPRLTGKRVVVLGCIAIVAAGTGVAFALTRDEKICTLIGGMTAVTVHLTAADLRDTKRATVCVAGRCTRLVRQASGVVIGVKASGPRLVPVMLVLERDGEPADVRAVRTRLKRFAPNGPGCDDPPWWNAEVTSDELPAVQKRRVGQIIGPPVD